MKFKHISLIEQHIEKAVLVLCVAFALFVVWRYVLSAGHTVEMNGRNVSASQIDQELLSTARTLEQRLTQGVPEQLTQVRIPPYADLFDQQLARTLTPPAPQGDGNQLLAPTLTGGEIAYVGSGMGDNIAQQPYRPLEIPAPNPMVLHPEMGTLAEPLPQALTQQANLDPPYDVGWVSVALRVNIGGILKQLDPTPGSGAQPIPRGWMQESFVIADVQVQRRTLRDDGTWSEPELVPLLPDQPSYRDLIDSGKPPGDWRQLLEEIRSAQPAIITPQFYDLRNTVWTPPILPPSDAEVAAEEGSGPTDAASLQRQLLTLQARLQSYEDQKERATMTGRSVPPQIDQNIERTQQQISQLLQRIQQAGGSTQEEMMTDDALPPGFIPPSGSRGSRGPGSRGPTAPVPAAELGPRPGSFTGSILALDQLEIWAMDFRVQPGQTCQYRARIVTTNPLFDRSLPKEQAELKNQFFVLGEWSEWSQPIQTLHNRYFFVVGGSRDQFAQVELWRFSEGLWLTTIGRVSPGDPIGTTSTSYEPLSGPDPADAGLQQHKPPLDFSTGYVAVDLDFDYKLAPGGVARSTLRLLYDDGIRLASRMELNDTQRRDDLKLMLFPELAQEQEMTMRQRQEAYKQRSDEAQQRAGQQTQTRTTQPGSRDAVGGGSRGAR